MLPTFRNWVATSGLRIATCGFRIAKFGFRVATFGLRIATFGLRIATFRLRIATLGLQIATFDSLSKPPFCPRNTVRSHFGSSLKPFWAVAILAQAAVSAPRRLQSEASLAQANLATVRSYFCSS